MGTLCSAHLRELAQCADITAEQIVSAAVADPVAWLIDQWGCTHPLAVLTLIGRSIDECGLAILHHSVSALHAQLNVEGDRARVVDRGSLNGTQVNGERDRSMAVFDGDLLRLGDVSFYLSMAAPHIQRSGGTGRTVPSRQRDLALAVVLQGHGGELELVQRLAGGIARIGDQSLELARLEFALLQALIERKQKFPDPELCFVSSAELSKMLDFKSRDADSDNVRELVRRVRRKLEASGVAGLIKSRQGVGYRVAWHIKDTSSSR